VGKEENQIIKSPTLALVKRVLRSFPYLVLVVYSVLLCLEQRGKPWDRNTIPGRTAGKGRTARNTYVVSLLAKIGKKQLPTARHHLAVSWQKASYHQKALEVRQAAKKETDQEG